MKPWLVVSVALLTLVGIALAGPEDGDEANASRSDQRESAGEERLHLMLMETESGVRVSPAEPDAKLKKGQYRVSCRSFTFEWRGDQPVLVFLDVVMESEEDRIAASKIIDYLPPPGSRRIEGVGWVKPMKGGSAQWLERQKEAIERGMKASELEHRQRWENLLHGTKASRWENRPRRGRRFEGHQKPDPR